MSKEVFVLSAARSAIGSFGGSLSGMEPAELAGEVMKASIERSGVEPKDYEFVTVGNVIPTESRFAYVARVASIQAGLPMESVAMAVNRLCSSGLQAIVSSAQAILLGDAELAIGGGVEVMSRGAYLSTAMRSGARMGDTTLIDSMVATLTDPFGVGHMGITAENLAEKWEISREEQDAFASSRIGGRPKRAKRDGLLTRSFPSRFGLDEARPSSTPTNTSAPIRTSKHSRKCGPRSKRMGA